MGGEERAGRMDKAATFVEPSLFVLGLRNIPCFLCYFSSSAIGLGTGDILFGCE